jgi:hypothetical protein
MIYSRVSAGSTSVDPYWDNVTLLVKFIGAVDTTSSFVDQSKKQRAIRRTNGSTVVSDPSYHWNETRLNLNFVNSSIIFS